LQGKKELLAIFQASRVASQNANDILTSFGNVFMELWLLGLFMVTMVMVDSP